MSRYLFAELIEDAISKVDHHCLRIACLADIDINEWGNAVGGWAVD